MKVNGKHENKQTNQNWSFGFCRFHFAGDEEGQTKGKKQQP
jgi:hypothetical protein